MTVQTGQTVQYFGSKGTAQAALVVGTAGDFDAAKAPEGTEPPAQGTATLVIFSRTGRTYTRQDVPMEGSDAHAALVEKAQARAAEIADAQAQNADQEEADEDGPGYVQVPRPLTVRYFKAIA